MVDSIDHPPTTPQTKLVMTPPTRIAGCMEKLQWRTELPPEIPLEVITKGLCERGFSDQSNFEWVWEFQNEAEHRVIIVPKTRRVQLRVHYLTPHDKRQTAAWQITMQLNDICLQMKQPQKH